MSTAGGDTPALGEISLLLDELIVRGENGPEATQEKVRLLTLAALLIHQEALTQFGGRPGLIEGVESSIASAFQTYGGDDLYPDDFMKAAAIWRGITGDGNAFVDGNKRTGFMLAMYYLARAGWPSPLTPLPIAETISYGLAIATRRITEVEEIASQLQEWWISFPDLDEP